MIRRVPLKIQPKFLPKGYRILGSREFVHLGDWYWSPKKRCYLPVTKKPEKMAGTVMCYIRRET